jgi:hypothetical protein
LSELWKSSKYCEASQKLLVINCWESAHDFARFNPANDAALGHDHRVILDLTIACHTCLSRYDDVSAHLYSARNSNLR